MSDTHSTVIPCVTVAAVVTSRWLLPGALVSLLRGCAHVSPGLFIGLREEMQSVGVLLGGFDDCCEPDRSGCVAHKLSGELGVDVERLVGGCGRRQAFRLQSCRGVVSSSDAFDYSAGVRQPGNDYEPRDGPPMGPGRSHWALSGGYPDASRRWGAPRAARPPPQTGHPLVHRTVRQPGKDYPARFSGVCPPTSRFAG